MAQIDAGWNMSEEKEAKENEGLVAEIFYTISNWVVVDTQWILNDKKTLVQVLEAVVSGLSPGKQVDVPVAVEVVSPPSTTIEQNGFKIMS